MKKVCIFILSLVCCFALAACIGGNNDTPKNNDNVFLVDKEITVYVGGTYKFEPTGAESFTYTSSDESVAKVSADGLLTGIADGTAFVDVSAGEVSVTCKVNVIKAENYIRLNQTGVTAAVGSDVILKAEVISGGKVSADEVKFDKGEADGVTVKQSGVNSAIISVTKTGSYVITVSCGTLKAECAVKAVNVTATTLETPVVSVENCKTVKWNAVEHAGTYMYSVNGDEWVKTAQTSFNAQEITDRLKFKDKVVFAVKALAGENDFDYIDGLPAAIDFSHDYVATTIEEYTCSKAGKVSFKCSVCDKEYLDENYLADHVMENGACVNCGLQQTKKVIYRYDKNNDCYFVVGADAGYNSEDLYILAKYNDGINGERPVKYIGYGAFAANKIIKRVILPESMTEFVDADNKYNKTDKNGVKVSSPLRGTVFDDCSNLEYVSMKGVTVLRDVADASYSHWNFRDCYNLKQVIVAEGFDNYGATFMRWVNTPDKSENQTDIYVCGDKITKLCNDSYPIGYDVGFGNNTLLTGDVFYYDEKSTSCYKWHYAADGITVISGGKHVFNGKNRCKKCGAQNDYGVNYGYYEGKDIDNVTDIKTYYVADNKTLNREEVVILDKYNDGLHGTLPVTFVKNQAFAGNQVIKKVTLSENITRLDGGVFLNCKNLEYVSMTGITDMEYINISNKLFYDAGVDTGNNFINCYGLKTLIVNKKFNLYKNADSQQFIGQNADWTPRLDLYSTGSIEESSINAAPNAKNNLLTGVVFYKGSLDKCRRWTEDDGVIEASAKDHDFVNGVCSICGEKDAMGVIYQYDEKYGVYYVAGYTGTGETLNVFGTWNDGKNGEKDVKYVAARAFQSKNTLKKVVLDAKIESLEGWVFAGCENLEYVSMVGVTNLEWASPYDGDGRDHNFRDCFKLKTLIAGNSFKTNCGQFGSGGTIANPVLDLYVYGNGAPSLTSTANDAYNLWTKKVYYYSAEQKSGCWYYDANGNAALWG